MKKRNQTNVHIVNLNVNEKSMETLLCQKDISSREIRKKKIGRLCRPISSPSQEIYKKIEKTCKTKDVSSPGIRPKLLRSVSAENARGGPSMPHNIKIGFQTHITTSQTSSFLPSFCYPVRISPKSRRNQEEEKRPKGESYSGTGPTQTLTPVCSAAQERKRSLTDAQCETLDVEKHPQSLEEIPDSTGPFKRRKSIPTSVPKSDVMKRRSSLKENEEASETVYAVYDSSSNSPPRLVRISNDADLTSAHVSDEIENVIGTDGGFQDIDLSLDPGTINLFWDDDAFWIKEEL